jgi:hypothetical protein
MAHRLTTHPPGLHCTMELSRAFRQILFTLEQDPWNHAPPGRQAATNLRSPAVHEAHITMLNVGATSGESPRYLPRLPADRGFD